MAYLTEHLSKQQLGVVNSSNGSNISEAVMQPTVSRALTNESSNFQTARRLNEEKTKLIDALAQFPITALWLLATHEKIDYPLDQDEEAVLASDLSSVLNDIKQHYLLASQTMRTHGLHSVAYDSSKQRLAAALQLFPFAFEELAQLADVIVYAYKMRGLCYQPANQANQQEARLIIQRLEGSKRRQSSQLTKMADLFRAIDAHNYDEQFLFLASTDMHRYFTELVLAEQAWLSARQQLAAANNKLVLFIANQYKASFLDFDDLVQEGQIGLLKAVDRFDYRLGFQFSTYAGYWIRQAISRSLSRCERLVRVPCGQVATINKVFRARNEFIAQTGQEPSVNGLAEYSKFSRDEIESILSISQSVMSLEGGSEDEEDAFAPIDFLEQHIFTHAFTSIAKADLDKLLNEAITALNPREAHVICCHFGIECDHPMTLQEIGTELNLTRERVRQIQVIALNKIKLNFGQQLMCFL